MSLFIRPLIVVLLCVYSEQRSTPEDSSYVAAVVEYQVQSNSASNLQNYIKIIGDAAEQNADIIVFPELTISSHESVVVPINGLLKEHPIPALQPQLFGEVLVSISSAARHHQIYVVINVQEVVNCTVGATGENCPEEKIYLFNTNVVFDRTGAVIDRYRKINLFGEFTRTPALTPDLGIFTTDFGVTFGHYVCFDLMFQVPAVQVVQKYNITDIIFPTMWFSEMPYLTAVQIQEAYAYAMNVNFLGAGANNVRVGSAGSGIYSGKAGALVSIMPGTPTTKLLVSRVPKVPGQVEGDYPGPINDDPLVLDSLVLMSDPSLPSYVTRLIKPGLEEFTLIDKDVVCRFKIHMSERNSDTKYTYRAGAFSGVRSYSGVATGGTRVCSVFACTGYTIDTCGKRFSRFSSNTTAVFEELTITAALPTPKQNTNLSANSSIYFPLSLDKTIKPLKTEYFKFDSVSFFDTLSIYTLELVKSTPDLYSFAIWGREYTTDDEEVSPPREHDEGPDNSTTTPAPEDDAPGSSVIHKSSLILLVTSIATLFTFVQIL